jgi:formimidoylglutamate deiminase
MGMRLRLEEAWLPEGGWAREVGLEVENGVIARVVPGAPPDFGEWRPGRAMPGLPNLHSHLFQRAMAGLAERRGPGQDSFWTWRQVMYGFLARLEPEDVEAIAAQAMVEMLERGFTALAEFHYLHHAPDGARYANPAEMAERVAAAAAQTGIGLTLLPALYTHGGFGALPPSEGQRRFLNGTDEYIRLFEASRRAIAPLEDARLGFAPHSLRAVADGQIGAVLAAFPVGPVHIHVAEQVAEVEACVAWCGQRPVERLLATEPVDARWCAVHATHMTAEEATALAGSDAIAGLCPITEANLGDGIFKAVGYSGAWGVGSDSNVEITAPGELRMLEYGQRLVHRGRNLLAGAEGDSTGETLYAAALAGGARACGRAVGRIAEGARADLVWLAPGTTLDDYVFVAGASAVREVIVAGRPVVAAGRHIAREAVAARFARTMARLRN